MARQITENSQDVIFSYFSGVKHGIILESQQREHPNEGTVCYNLRKRKLQKNIMRGTKCVLDVKLSNEFRCGDQSCFSRR